ncbi:multidrug effflux MFS transporter [Motiliproteus sp. MSK22-1]|uniref:multidrug effflux MFS transporter n=1 Tax=Motiliproteus sp. MSK22-1 TaxID=1897630 RepID=UPI000977107B|nr:multidrug effflux MFS transporter [Motiliproteus sp. MSK22-1]OMH25836.1 hypothetical protein BGP75_25285 [Motiliproteus sp. MSK22-1]
MNRSSFAILLLATFLILFSPLGIDIYLPALPTLARVFEATSAEIQYTLSLFIFASGLGQLVAGPLADRYGRRPIALCSIVLFLLSSLAAAAAQDLFQLYISRTLQGLAACGTSVVSYTLIRDRFNGNDRATAYNYLNGSLCVAPAMAPFLGAVLADSFGWRWIFVALAAFSICVFGYIYARLPETRPDSTLKPESLFSLKHYGPLFSNSSFLYYGFACMAALASIICYVSFAPLVLIQELGLSQKDFGILFGANAVLIILANLFAPRIISRLGAFSTVISGCSILGGAGLIMLLSYYLNQTTLLGYVIPVAIASIGFALILGAATSQALAPFPDQAGTASAALGCGQMVGAATISAMALETGWSGTLAVSMVLAVLGGSCLIAGVGFGQRLQSVRSVQPKA